MIAQGPYREVSRVLCRTAIRCASWTELGHSLRAPLGNPPAVAAVQRSSALQARVYPLAARSAGLPLSLLSGTVSVTGRRRLVGARATLEEPEGGLAEGPVGDSPPATFGFLVRRLLRPHCLGGIGLELFAPVVARSGASGWRRA